MRNVPENSIADLRALAQRRLPRALFDYIDRGSYDEFTWTRNRDDLRALMLRQRVMVDVSKLDTSLTVLGQRWAFPLALAPTGMTGLFHRDGEIQAARAAQAAGVPYCLSTMSICTIEDVRAAFDGTMWFQLYVMRDRGFTEALIARAQAARCPVLVITVDLPLQALRRRDPKNGLAVPPRLTFASAVDFARRPAWLLDMARNKRRTFGNLDSFFPDKGTAEISEWMGSQLGPLTPADLTWVRDRWPGKLIIKGVLDPEDARAALGIGADAIVVSNHGGRQLDGATSTIAAVPRVRDAVGERCAVLMDGGISSGQDVLKAIAMGAHGCLTGKAFLYGLAARGQPGVALALDIMRREFETSMALCGVAEASRVDRSILLN